MSNEFLARQSAIAEAAALYRMIGPENSVEVTPRAVIERGRRLELEDPLVLPCYLDPDGSRHRDSLVAGTMQNGVYCVKGWRKHDKAHRHPELS